MKGKLYGIGTGPGDNELLTLKAIKVMEKCHVIAIPNDGNGGRIAFEIVEEYVSHKPLIECSFSMDKCKITRKEARQKVANDIEDMLKLGKNVGFITLGDPTIYSTYMYVHKLISARGFETEIISGIPSFVAAAAMLNTSLCEGEESLHIIPVSQKTEQEIEDMLRLSGNKIIMKSGKKFNTILNIIEKLELSEKTQIVERCGMINQQIYKDFDKFKDIDNASYFSIIIVKG